ncbi:uncharacterized protein FIBRA_03431 [Fibroporia radiculosa]|uniref:Peptidase M48 domain-containing protein n=1 Tax=Fibroporia radiculosa TaxID=599839 RepID=J4I9L7_9APHY|nr:uncharacterized protein FIBRA_03431 [Fibroporia radiculosa]CCM01381.1 predicted protein [Fibroporia radiculosa]
MVVFHNPPVEIHLEGEPDTNTRAPDHWIATFLSQTQGYWHDHGKRETNISHDIFDKVLLSPSFTGSVQGTITRIALTFLPVLFIRGLAGRKQLERLEKEIEVHSSRTDLHDKRTRILQKLKKTCGLVHFLLLTPICLLGLTIFASLERAPLTGRWRLMLLSPEEEADIAAQLAGPGWYQAVSEILFQNNRSTLLDPMDWRVGWVQDTLRRLEQTIPMLLREKELHPDWMERSASDTPCPPPAEFPLRPRPQVSEYYRRFGEVVRTLQDSQDPSAGTIPGPPYSLLVVDRPDSSNAFSYGYGGDGGGGLVVFSGFLDDILSKSAGRVAPTSKPTSWWNTLFNGPLFGSPTVTHPVPTGEQTSELAILLAHELAHLVMAHHLETLSHGSIIGPGVMSILTDVARTLVFPVTMLFGPFINDALAGLGEVGSGEFVRMSEYCTSQKQEIEADIVSARLLAHAGFDPRHAVRFWESRHETADMSECSTATHEESLPRRWTGSGHPVNKIRVQKLKEELDRWEVAKQKALAERKGEAKHGCLRSR